MVFGVNERKLTGGDGRSLKGLKKYEDMITIYIHLIIAKTGYNTKNVHNAEPGMANCGR